MEILYTNPRIAVCLKPVGMDSEADVPNALKDLLGGDIFSVHRLDQNVGGVMVYARTKAAAVELSRAIQEGTVVKEYIALIHGTPPENGDWTDLLWKDSIRNKVFIAKSQRKGVKKARLEFRRLTEGTDSLVRIRLHTGRSHQIRVQFASRGFPLVGDHKYGARDDAAAPYLFSCKLTFPLGGKTYTFESLPDWAGIKAEPDTRKTGAGIQICGLNGCGKSTLGRALAERLGFHFIDNEDLYFSRTGPNEPYTNPRSREEAEKLLMKEVQAHPNFVFAAVKGNYGDAILPMYNYVILLEVPREIRLQRVRDRAQQKFGSRIQPGGDLHNEEEAFFQMVASRQDDFVEKYLQRVTCPIIRVDGTKPVEENVESIICQIGL